MLIHDAYRMTNCFEGKAEAKHLSHPRECLHDHVKQWVRGTVSIDLPVLRLDTLVTTNLVRSLRWEEHARRTSQKCHAESILYTKRLDKKLMLPQHLD